MAHVSPKLQINFFHGSQKGFCYIDFLHMSY